jgi:phosphoribosyl-dephospho-CoA transferase
MEMPGKQRVRVHDFVEIDLDSINPDEHAAPAWANSTRSSGCWAIVRRGVGPAGQIPIGIRGYTRDNRWSTFCLKRGIRRVTRPEDLLANHRLQRPGGCTLAIRVLDDMVQMWSDLALVWGPIGSVGYELATGEPVTTDTSDLDLVLHAALPISRTFAISLLRRTERLPVRVDVRVETPRSGFSLNEFACSSGGSILLRHNHGLSLSRDPWITEPEKIEIPVETIP